MKKLLFGTLVIAGHSAVLLAEPRTAQAGILNGQSLGNGSHLNDAGRGNGRAPNGADLGGLSLKGVILPE